MVAKNKYLVKIVFAQPFNSSPETFELEREVVSVHSAAAIRQVETAIKKGKINVPQWTWSHLVTMIISVSEPMPV
jgi:hypothetical protein